MPTDTAATAEVVVRVRDLTKRFGEVTANDGISFEIRRGEVHCLLGENGAGKSTLISMLAGMRRPDSGGIDIAGRPVDLGSPAQSLRQGIGIVYQHSTLIPTLSVRENLMLGDRGRFWLDRVRADERLAELTELLGARINPRTPAGELGLGQQQLLEIVKALWRQPQVLVLDEPTSLLPPHAIDELLASVRRLRHEGIAVVFVSHKLREALAIGDAVTVLRGGRVSGRIAPAELRDLTERRVRELILAAMFGHEPTAEAEIGAAIEAEAEQLPASLAQPPTRLVPTMAQTVLELHGVSSAGVSSASVSSAYGASDAPITNIDLALHSGEVVGVAGIDGHGQRALAEVVAGQRAAASGRVAFDGRDITRLGVRERQRLGVRYVTSDRAGEGSVGGLSVALNLVLKRIGERPFWGRFGRMDRGAVLDEARERIAEFDIRPPKPDTRAGTLSGGNLQRVLLARELSHGPRVVVFHAPTHGLDLQAVRRVREAVRELVAAGGCALLISTDLDELAELADRVIVLANGRIAGEVTAADGRLAERVGELMSGDRGGAFDVSESEATL